MRLTFEQDEWLNTAAAFKTVRHLVRSIALAFGDQGIPNGFQLNAACGARQESEGLALDDNAPVNCPRCLEAAR